MRSFAHVVLFNACLRVLWHVFFSAFGICTLLFFALVVFFAGAAVEVFYVYIPTTSLFVSTQAWFRHCFTHGRRKFLISPGLEALWPTLQPVRLAPISNGAKSAPIAWVCADTLFAPDLCLRHAF